MVLCMSGKTITANWIDVRPGPDSIDSGIKDIILIGPVNIERPTISWPGYQSK